MKKSFSVILSIVLLTVFSSNLAFAKEGYFTDVDSTHPNYGAIQDLKEKNIVNGYSDGTFKPDSLINRAELITMVTNMKGGLTISEAQISSYENCFTDVKSEWYAHGVCNAKMQKWVDGYPDGTFGGSKNANRAEAIKIIVNTFYDDSGEMPEVTDAERNLNHLPTNLDENVWYYNLLNFAIRKNILDPIGMEYKSDGSFTYDVSGNITRKEVAEMIYRLQKIHNNFIVNQKDYLTGDWVAKVSRIINGIEVEDYISVNILVNNGSINGTFVSGASTEGTGAMYIDSGTFNGKYEIGDKYSLDGGWEGERNDHGNFVIEYDPISYTILWQSNIAASDGLYTLPEFFRLEKVIVSVPEN